MTRFLIADDHAILRRGLKQILLDEFPSAIIEEVDDAEKMIEKAVQEPWDLVISDLSMPGRGGFEALQQMHSTVPKLPVLILSNHPEEQFAMRLLKAGAFGYLNKETVPEELAKAVRRILQGRKYLTPSLAEKLADSLQEDGEKAPHEKLSNREFDVFRLLAAGKTVGEIAASMYLSVTTVSTYRARILAKIGLRNNADIMQYAMQNKLI